MKDSTHCKICDDGILVKDGKCNPENKCVSENC